MLSIMVIKVTIPIKIAIVSITIILIIIGVIIITITIAAIPCPRLLDSERVNDTFDDNEQLEAASCIFIYDRHMPSFIRWSKNLGLQGRCSP